MHAKALLEAGCPMEEACATFLRLDEADLCYLLDADGVQVGPRVFRDAPDATAGGVCDPFAPLLDVRGARWSRRPYFMRALAAPGELQVTRPYPTMHSRRMNVTLSLCFTFGGAQRVVCGDKLWQSGDERPGFGVTTRGGLEHLNQDMALPARRPRERQTPLRTRAVADRTTPR